MVLDNGISLLTGIDAESSLACRFGVRACPLTLWLAGVAGGD